MARVVRDAILQVKREFGISLEVLKIDPDKLWADDLDMDIAEKSDALADWAMHKTRNIVPLVVFDGNKIESAEDLFRVLQSDSL